MKNIRTNKIKFFACIIVLVLIFLSSCQPSDEKVNDNRQINKELLSKKSALTHDIENQKSVLSELKEEQDFINKIVSLDSPRYILTLELKQSHVSLDLGKHMKDEMNKIQFQMPVDQIFYKSVKVGDNLVDEFRSGSFVMDGSFGSWKMKVIKKEIK